MNNFFFNRIITRCIYTVIITVLLLILLNQNVFAQSSKKTSKILEAACLYKPNTTFLFEAVYDSSGTIQTEYIVMSIFPAVYAGEIVILYTYYKNIPEIVNGDSIVNVEDQIEKMGEETLLIDHKKYIKLHPPRGGKYILSEYFPFPSMKLPVKAGEKSKYGFLTTHIPVPTTHKFLWLKYKMKNFSAIPYQYKDSLIEIYEKKGTVVSYIGENTASYLFNEDLGFVKWRLSTSYNVSLEFTLIDTYPFLLRNYKQHTLHIK